jgi:hypothetical protein
MRKILLLIFAQFFVNFFSISDIKNLASGSRLFKDYLKSSFFNL